MNAKKFRAAVAGLLLLATLIGVALPQATVSAQDDGSWCQRPNTWDGQRCWAPSPDGGGTSPGGSGPVTNWEDGSLAWALVPTGAFNWNVNPAKGWAAEGGCQAWGPCEAVVTYWLPYSRATYGPGLAINTPVKVATMPMGDISQNGYIGPATVDGYRLQLDCSVADPAGNFGCHVNRARHSR